MAEITEREIKLLDQFREKIGELLESDYKRSNGYLVSWIRYAKHDLVKAETAFRKTAKWRQELRMNTILEEEMNRLKTLFPYEFTVDKEGLPVCVVQFGKWDIRKEVELGPGNREILYRYMIQWCELMAVEIQKQAEATNGRVNQFMGVFDLEGFAFKQMASTKTIKFMTDLAHAAETHWPLIVNSLYVVNSPSVIKVLLNILKPFLSSTTVSGIKIFTSNRADWEIALLKRISSEHLPIFYGGEKSSIFNTPQP